MTKEEVLQATLRFLKDNPKTQFAAIHENIKNILKARGEIGAITTGNQYYSTTQYVDISDSDAMLVNEVIYDLIIERVLTPGVDKHNLNFPFLTVTSMDRLNRFLRE
ncbi:hypothetical protein G3578_07475 [Brevibacillus sp. SYP-B805]|uniref:hypothetical protein n=1 Tax=Brevibacillus sp. SYP-B805 TaxID=1578199 RepID=UPI0013EBF2A8|nr:hypothetical protein [Brevibacillus sp. SYP-B805]NGQ95025.1 hypothetical protein [Brevibacillus sp. SYP-B805]